jgi:endonuclease G
VGNPSKAQTSGDLTNLLRIRPQFAISYNRDLGGANWVAWHLQRSHLGRTGRTDAFAPDLTLPSELRIRQTEYAGSGFERGHQCPSGDRTRSVPDNEATFVMSNMLPQTDGLNGGPWARLEEYCRDRVKAGNELYIVCGGHGTRGRIAGGRVNIPFHCWKVILELPAGSNDPNRINTNTRVFAVDMPNQQEVKGDRWQKFIVTVDMVEAATNLDFFSALPTALQDVLEQKLDPGRAPSRRRNR